MAKDKWNEWVWLVQTPKGDFFMTVLGSWTQEEAADKLRQVFDGLELAIVGMIPRKRPSGPDDNRGTIIEQLEPKDDLGYEFLAGKKFWHLLGRGGEYDAQLILEEEKLKEDIKRGGG